MAKVLTHGIHKNGAGIKAIECRKGFGGMDKTKGSGFLMEVSARKSCWRLKSGILLRGCLNTPNEPFLSRNIVYITALPAGLYALLHWAGYYWPVRLWGVDLFHYYPPSYLILFLLSAAALFCLAATRQYLWIAIAARRLAHWMERRGWVGDGVRLGALLLFFVAAYSFRVREHVLGDSQLRFAELEKFYELAVEMPGLFAVLARIFAEGNLRFESLDFAIHLLIFSIGKQVGTWTPEEAYAWPSFLAGGLYLVALWKVGGLLGTTALQRLSYFATGITLGTIQLFLGYGESYTLVTACAGLYLLLGLRCMRGGSLLYPALGLIVCAALHVISISLVVSLFYLLWQKIGRPGGHHLARRGVQLAAWPLALVASVWLYAHFYPIRMPLWVPAAEGQYALFSAGHAMLLINAAFLISPFGLVWGIASWAKRLASRSEDVFLAWAAWGPMALIFFHNAFLGGRDWDLLSFPGLFCALWGTRALLRFPQKLGALALLWTVILPLMFWHTGMWIALNMDARRTHERLVNLLWSSNQSIHYRHYTMGYYYFRREGEIEEAIRHFGRALDILSAESESYELDAARYEKWLGRVLIQGGQYAKGRDALERAFARQGGKSQYKEDVHFLKDLVFAYLNLYSRELKEGNPRRIQSYLERAMAYCHRVLEIREDASAYLYLGFALDLQDRPAEAAAAFHQSLKLLTDRAMIIDAYSHLAYSLEKIEEPDMAARALLEGAARVSSAKLYAELVALYTRYGEPELARAAREEAVRLGGTRAE